MISQDQEEQLGEAWIFVAQFEPLGRTRRQFWDEFEQSFGKLGKEAWANDADPVLLERYLDIMNLADDRGLMGPDDTLDEVMV